MRQVAGRAVGFSGSRVSRRSGWAVLASLAAWSVLAGCPGGSGEPGTDSSVEVDAALEVEVALDGAGDVGAADLPQADEGSPELPPGDDGMTDVPSADEGGPDVVESDDGGADLGGPDVVESDEGGADVATADDGSQDVPTADEGAPDVTPGDEGAPDVPTADEGSLDVPLTDEGTVDAPVTDEGTVDVPLTDGTVDVPLTDAAVDVPLTDGAGPDVVMGDATGNDGAADDAEPDAEVSDALVDAEVDAVTDAVADGSDSQIEPDTGPLACEQAPPTPLPYETLSGYSTGEDFALNSQGDYYSNEAGDLIVIKAGQKKMQLFLPNIGTTAGMAFLPNGDLIVASADSGSLLKITTVGTKASPAGSIQTLLSGLQYPNGLDLDYDGTVFVAEQDGQRLRAVNSKTGEWTIVADNLCNANGVSFGVDYSRVYVGSFGCGLVYGIDRLPDGSWDTPFAIGKGGLVDGSSPGEDALNWCEGQAAGDLCGSTSVAAGKCVETMDGLACEPAKGAVPPLQAACAGKPSGAPCSVGALGQTFPGFCGNFFGSPSECNIDDDPTCNAFSIGDPCIKLTYGYPYFGTCLPTGAGTLRCGGEPPIVGVEDHAIGSGGLDGLNVDECGYIYVTEYVAGIIWRIDPDLGPPVAVRTLPSNWIPNMHWGVGAGGWDPTTLYVADRDEGRIFALKPGVLGKESTKPEAP